MAEGARALTAPLPAIGRLMDLLAPFKLSREGAATHLWRLVDSDDEVLKVGAICTLFDSGAIKGQHIAQIMASSGHTAVCGRLFNYLLSRYEFQLAAQLADRAPNPETLSVRQRLRALLDEDWATLVEVERLAFLTDGQIEHLGRAADYAERLAGWEEAALWALRAVLLTPVAPQPAGKLLTIFENANRFEEMRRLRDIFRKANLHRDMCLLLEGRLCLHDNNYAQLERAVSAIALDKLDERIRPKAFTLMARACEAQGKYREAVAWFEKQNDSGRAPPLGQDGRFFSHVGKLEQIQVGELSPDKHADSHFAMLGFPRSGTTLLENALAAHPHIETFEEIPSDTIMFRAMSNVAAGVLDADARRRGFEAARERYYGELQRRSRKSSAKIFIDKLPLRSAYVRVLERMFPQRKYIFSIRHPYDVVLSCFQQRFKLNQAMENFRRFDDACALYDQVMQRWFEAFPGPSQRVHYVKYDDLVLNFDEEIRKVLAFVGIEWDEAVRNFAAAAERRKVATPSYSKVRAGLDLGVQTRWRNYSFLFEKPAAAPLKRWVERFGYQTA
jgi:Sulfotransferase family